MVDAYRTGRSTNAEEISAVLKQKALPALQEELFYYII
jgi:hypothetical protein